MAIVEFSATVLGYHPKYGELIAASAAQEAVQIFSKRCEQLSAENEALKAHVEQYAILFNESPDLTFDVCQRMFSEELAKLRAQAVRDAMCECNPMLPIDDYRDQLFDYADKIERGEA